MSDCPTNGTTVTLFWPIAYIYVDNLALILRIIVWEIQPKYYEHLCGKSSPDITDTNLSIHSSTDSCNSLAMDRARLVCNKIS